MKDPPTTYSCSSMPPILCGLSVLPAVTRRALNYDIHYQGDYSTLEHHQLLSIGPYPRCMHMKQSCRKFAICTACQIHRERIKSKRITRECPRWPKGSGYIYQSPLSGSIAEARHFHPPFFSPPFPFVFLVPRSRFRGYHSFSRKVMRDGTTV